MCLSISQVSAASLTDVEAGVWQAFVVMAVRVVSSLEGDSDASVLLEDMRNPTALSPPDPSHQNLS